LAPGSHANTFTSPARSYSKAAQLHSFSQPRSKQHMLKQQTHKRAAAPGFSGPVTRQEVLDKILAAKQVDQIQQLLLQHPDSWR
jgi:hypothetical protein